jgi:hypothetical protein
MHAQPETIKEGSNMKKMRAAISTAITLMLLLTLIPSAYAYETVQTQGGQNVQQVQQKRVTETQSTQEYSRLIQEFDVEEYGGSQESYPEYYAGAYIDGKGELIVLTTEDTATVKDEIKAATDNPNVASKKAPYSYNYLNELMDQIHDRLANRLELGIASAQDEHSLDPLLSIVGFGVYDDKNCIIVEIDGISPQKIAAFKQLVSSSPAIRFEEGNPVYATVGAPSDTAPDGTSTRGMQSSHLSVGANALASPITVGLNLGEGLIIGGSGYSLGFRARRTVNGTTQYGFVTAAHGTSTNQGVSASSYGQVGTIRSRQFSGTVDAAFVQVTPGSNFSVTNSIRGTGLTLSGNGSAIPSVGSTIHKSAYTTGGTSGTVQSINYQTQYLGTTLTHTIKATYHSAGGDSGGCVYFLPSTGVPSLVGITTAAGSGYSVCIRAEDIVNALGVMNY